MLKPARTDRVTEALPALTPVCKPSDFVDVDYTPALLLCTSFTWPFLGDPNHHIACKCGFDAYFEGMYDWNADGTDMIFVDHFYTWREVVQWLTESVCDRKDYPIGERMSLSWRVGIAVGWLSALALVDAGLAAQGLQVLANLVQFECLRDNVCGAPSPACFSSMVPAPSACACGSGSWPMDL
jgi:hypothetical protein